MWFSIMFFLKKNFVFGSDRDYIKSVCLYISFIKGKWIFIYIFEYNCLIVIEIL